MTMNHLKLNKISFCSLIEKSTIQSFFPHLSGKTFKKYLGNKKNINRLIDKREELSLSIDLINYGLINPTYQGADPEKIYEDDLFLVYNKPPDIFSHPLKYSESDNFLSFLRSKKNGSILDVNKENYDRGLLFRLDYVTSGVLIYCKDHEAFQLIRENFSEVAVAKIYLAIVEGDFHLEGEQVQWFVHHGIKNKKIKVFSNSQENGFKGKMTISKICYNKIDSLSLLQIELKTGLRHQIRAGLSALGYPILGDLEYGGREGDRVYLHAFEYALKQNEKVMKFNAYKTWGFEKLGFNFNP